MRRYIASHQATINKKVELFGPAYSVLHVYIERELQTIIELATQLKTFANKRGHKTSEMLTSADITEAYRIHRNRQ
jgi:hypothetical protein